jgi:hypothetical protein
LWYVSAAQSNELQLRWTPHMQAMEMLEHILHHAGTVSFHILHNYVFFTA